MSTNVERISRCKPYHESKGLEDEGYQRSDVDQDKKSRCPGWAASPELRRRLLHEAIEDPDGGKDRHGRPKRLWNAVNGWTFVAVSTQENAPAYNCYPDTPATAVGEDLADRALRTVEDLLGTDARPGPLPGDAS